MRKTITTFGLVTLAGLLGLLAGCSDRQEASAMSSGDDGNAPRGAYEPNAPETATPTATFAAGCFWGVEAAFREMPGVTFTEVGYTGGHTEDPTYKEVCSHTTGHAEAVRLTYDPAQLTYQDLLDRLFKIHDPTTLNRQGPDVGDQYRSAIFYHDDQQKRLAEQTVAQLNEAGRFARPIVTQIVPAETFWRAEEYHQQYLEKRGRASCHTGLK